MTQEEKDKKRADELLNKDTLFMSNASNVLSGVGISESIVTEDDPYKKSIVEGNKPILIPKTKYNEGMNGQIGDTLRDEDTLSSKDILDESVEKSSQKLEELR